MSDTGDMRGDRKPGPVQQSITRRLNARLAELYGNDQVRSAVAVADGRFIITFFDSSTSTVIATAQFFDPENGIVQVHQAPDGMFPVGAVSETANVVHQETSRTR
jgi:hypothetical protein